MLYELLGLWMGFAVCLLASCHPGPVRARLPRARALSARDAVAAPKP